MILGVIDLEKLQIFQHQEPKERTLASTNVPDHEIEAK